MMNDLPYSTWYLSFSLLYKSIINIDLPYPVTLVAGGTASLGAFCGCLDHRYLSTDEVDHLKATS